LSARRPLASLLFCAALAGCGGSGETAPPAYDVRADPRIAPLGEGCARSDYYDRNVADVIPILVEKLATGELDPLRRAKEELAALGSAAIPEVRRFLEQHYTEPHGIPYVSNALDVLKQSQAPEARAILLRCLEHPGDSIRLSAVQGLRLGHAEPEDFDVLERHLLLEIPEQRHQVALALHTADPARAEDLYLAWIRAGELPGLQRYVAPLLAASARPETQAAAAEVFPAADPAVRAFVAAAAARAGDAAALAFLAAELGAGQGNPERRMTAVTAAVQAGLEPLLAEALARDQDPEVRAVAAGGLGAGALGDDARSALRYALDDLSARVRAAALDALVGRGDPVAIDRVLGQLGGGTASLQEAMSALLRHLPEDPALAERALDRLLELDALEEFLPLQQRASTLKSIGQVPSARAARFLRDLARAHLADEVEGLPAHEWLMIQAANTGDAGRSLLLGELATETDPRRRLDLLWSGSAARTDATRSELALLLDSGHLSPEELLFVSDRLARLGPAAEMAPRLKRAAARVEDPRVRLALNCLLWRWY
jgi:hypothetical protein